jgi:hypothetical protein
MVASLAHADRGTDGVGDAGEKNVFDVLEPFDVAKLHQLLRLM